MTGPTESLADATVDEVMARHPEAMAVFNAFGVDSCCGAHSTIREACARDGVDEAQLVRALERAVERPLEADA